jgi:hypothetical protein
MAGGAPALRHSRRRTAPRRPFSLAIRSLALIGVLVLSAPAWASGLSSQVAASSGRRHQGDHQSLTSMAPPGGTLLSVSCSDTSWAAANGEEGIFRATGLSGGSALGPDRVTWPRRVPRNCITVGDNETRTGPRKLALLRLGTGKWRVSATPNSGHVAGALLSAVSCPAAQRCVAVGSSFGREGRAVPLAEAWNGVSWRVLPTPAPRVRGGVGSRLYSVSCRSIRSCVAVGDAQGRSAVRTLAEGWNGRRWRILPSLNARRAKVSILSGVSCSGTRACTAVGTAGNWGGSGSALAERWNGVRWRMQRAVSAPHSADSVLNSVSCPAAGTCVAVGSSGPSDNPVVLAESWNGARWRRLPTPAPAGGAVSSLADVFCQSRRHCVAVGDHRQEFQSYAALIESWNGRRWTIQAAPGRGSLSYLYGVFCRSASRCVAVGDYAPTPDTRAPLVQRWDGSRWRVWQVPGP